MRGVLVATLAEPAVHASGQPLDRAGEAAATGLTADRRGIDEPGHLDHAALAFVWQMAMEGIIGTPERGEGAINGLDFRGDERLDVVSAGQEAQATGVRL